MQVLEKTLPCQRNLLKIHYFEEVEPHLSGYALDLVGHQLLETLSFRYNDDVRLFFLNEIIIIIIIIIIAR